VTARLTRTERRALQRDDAVYLDKPLVFAGNPRSAAAHVRHMVHLLSQPAADSPCSDAIAHIGVVLDRTIPPAAAQSLACGRGCSHCCVQMVTVSAPEALFVAAQIRKRTPAVAAMIAADARTRGLSLEDRLQLRQKCPLLSQDLCSIYAGRPLGCRGFVSVNLNACIAAFDHGAAPEIPTPSIYVDVLHSCRMLLIAALRLRGLKDASYELNAAVTAALAIEDAETRWLAGEDVFADVPVTGEIPPAFNTAIAQLVNHVAPTV
jgi:Fe-S-cluster containining protein